MLPIECVVTGAPVSHQTHNRERLRQWQRQIAEAARAVMRPGQIPVVEPCQLVIVYFYSQVPVLLDNDNLAKPIADALNGIWFEDDRYITDMVIRRCSLLLEFRLRGMPVILQESLMSGDQFVYVRLEAAPPHEEWL